MFYSSAFFEVLGDTKGKPVDIILFGGIISVNTHPGDETSIALRDAVKDVHLPRLRFTGDRVRIDKQSLSNFLPPYRQLAYEIFVPEGSDVNIIMRGGMLDIAGRYGELRARNDGGMIRVNCENSGAAKNSFVSVFAGEIRLKNYYGEKLPRRHHLVIPFGESKLRVRVSLGEIRTVREKSPSPSKTLPAHVNFMPPEPVL